MFKTFKNCTCLGYFNFRSGRCPRRRPWLATLSLVVLWQASGAAAEAAEALADTAPLTIEGDVSVQMQAAVDRFLLRLTDTSSVTRQRYWKNNYASIQAYRDSVAPNRERFRRLIGVVDPREEYKAMQVVATVDDPPLVAETERIRIRAVRWPVFPGVTGEGLLLEPKGRLHSNVVALPDADWTPEVVAGIEKAPIPGADYGRRLAEAGCRVVVPTLIDRRDTWSGNPAIRMLNQPHREFLYRTAFYLGRHPIGYEVQKVRSAIDYLDRVEERSANGASTGVIGYGEGGLIALYSAAVDERIDATMVSGYFQQREGLWKEPIYRNVWGLLREFGDAEIASLVAPRALVIEACRGVEIDGPPSPREGRNYAASGVLTTPSIESVRAEFARARSHFHRLGVNGQCVLVESANGTGPPGSEPALQHFLERLNRETMLPDPSQHLEDRRTSFHPDERMKRQFQQFVAFNQIRFWEAGRRRSLYWSNVDRSSLENWDRSVQPYRERFLREIVGDWAIEPSAPNPRTRLLYETDTWRGYEVVFDVASDLWAYGILLVPKSIPPDEKRPVVVAQHGRGGRPQDVCDPDRDHRAYHSFGARLAARGFVVYAPQNLYFGEEKYRLIQRKANPLGMSFFAPMVWQHRAALSWLGSLPFVDRDRIAFYGLSYGGKSALVIPAVLEGYCLSICSGAFTDTVRKHVDVLGGNRAVFQFTNEYEHLEFDFAERFNHAEMAWLISPRPFMVEKGHRDGGLPDEWTAFEYARVRRHYLQLGIPELTQIEFFDGSHEINQAGTFDFLHRYLRYP